MSTPLRSIIFRLFMTVIFVCPFVVPGKTLSGQEEAVKAYYLKDMPADFGKIAKIFESFQKTGANMVIVGQTTANAPMPKKILANVVFLAHQKGLKLYVVVPTRGNSLLLASHPDWEDRSYDLQKRSMVSSHMIDLFNPEARKTVVESVKEAASSSADGIFLSDDLLYGEGDGMGRAASDEYRRKFNADPDPQKIFPKAVQGNSSSGGAAGYGEQYDNFIRMQQEMLLTLAQDILSASKSVNGSVHIVLPLRFDCYAEVLNLRPEYCRVVKTFLNVNPDFYWIALPHHEEEDLNYRKGMEAIARTATVVSDAVANQGRVMIVLPLTDHTGKPLASTEIEEATDMAHKRGKTFVAYEVAGATQLRIPLMKKLFREP